MKNFMLEHLNEISGTNIKEMEEFTFLISFTKRRFNGLRLEFLRNTVTYGLEWVPDKTHYNGLLNCKIRTKEQAKIDAKNW